MSSEILNYSSRVSKPNVDNLLADIRKLVAERRQRGDYPAGLEQELEAEFRGVVDRERRDWVATTRRLEVQQRLVAESLSRLTGVTDTQSRFPGGSAVHLLIRRLIGRQVRGLAAQVRDASEQVAVLVSMVAELQKSQEDADRRLVAHLAKNTLDRMAVVDHLAIVMTDLEKRFDAQFPR